MASEWKLVFYLCAAAYLFGAVAYGLLASGKVQPWASTGVSERVAILDDASSSEDLLSVNSGRGYRATDPAERYEEISSH